MWVTIRSPGSEVRTAEVIGDRLVVGRDPGSDMVLDDPEVSRQHALLERRPGGRLALRDLGSRNGTYVNGRRLEGELELEGGEEVRLGDTTLSLSLQGPVRGTQPAARSVGQTTVQRLVSAVLKTETARVRRSARVAIVVSALAVVAAVAVAALFATGVLPPGDEPATVEEVVDAIRPSTVLVATSLDGERTGNGTGWVLDASHGLIVTNAHVVNAGEQFSVAVDGSQRPATVVGNAPCEDLAVLRVSDTSNLRTLPLGSQDSVKEGETVVAVGFPGSLSNRDQLTTTTGVVSVAHTRLSDPGLVDVPAYPNVVLTDTAINPGNSGGPLVDLHAKLVGVNSAGDNARQNQNFAIGVDRVSGVTRDLRRGRSRGWTGFGVEYPTAESDLTSLDLPPQAGLILTHAVPDTPAADANIQFPALLVAVDDTQIDNRLQTYCRAAGRRGHGDSATLTVYEPGTTTPREIKVAFE
jgi:serine protease Do